MNLVNLITNNIYTLGFLSDLVTGLRGLFRVMVLIRDPILMLVFLTYGASLLLNMIIYPLAAYAYTLFPLMAQANFSSLTEDLQLIVNRIEIFIGIFMLFVVAFSVLRYMVDPDKNSAEAGNIAKKVVISIVLLVSSTLIFGLLDDLQNALVGKGSDNLVEVILSGPNGDLVPDESGSEYESYHKIGRQISYNAFFSMYSNNTDIGHEWDKTERPKLMDGKIGFISIISCYAESVLLGNSDGSDAETGSNTIWGIMYNVGDGGIRYTYPVLAEALGLFLMVMFICFAVDMGVRNFTLMFLRIMFPIAALGYLVPKKGDEILNKYVKAYMTAYVELFVKTFTIYLLLYILLWIMNLLFGDGNTSTVFGDTGSDAVTRALLFILLIVALFLFFFKGFPKLMKDIFGVEMGNSLGGILGKALGFGAAAAGLIAGGAIGATKAAKAGGGFGAALKGAGKGAAQMARTGWGTGKSLAAGKISDAFKGASTGIRDITGRKKQSLGDMLGGIKDATNKADEAVAAYEAADAKAKELEAKARASGSEEDRIKAANARQAADKAKQDALKKTEEAQKLNRNYKNSLSPTSKNEEAKAKRAAKKQQRREARTQTSESSQGTVIHETSDATVVTPTVTIDASGGSAPAQVIVNSDDDVISVTYNQPQAAVEYEASDATVVTPIATTTVAAATAVQEPTTVQSQQPTTVQSQQPATVVGEEQRTIHTTAGTPVNAPASREERQEAAQYTEKMQEKKEEVSQETRSEIGRTIDRIEKTTVSPDNRTRLSESGGGYTMVDSNGHAGGYGYTAYTGSGEYESPNGEGSKHDSAYYNEVATGVRKVDNGVEYIGTDGKPHVLKKPSFIDRPDAKAEDVQNLDSKRKAERTENLKSRLDATRVANRTREIVAEEGKSPEEAYEMATDEEIEAISKRVDELISQGKTEEEAKDIAIKEYEGE